MPLQPAVNATATSYLMPLQPAVNATATSCQCHCTQTCMNVCSSTGEPDTSEHAITVTLHKVESKSDLTFGSGLGTDQLTVTYCSILEYILFHGFWFPFCNVACVLWLCESLPAVKKEHVL